MRNHKKKTDSRARRLQKARRRGARVVQRKGGACACAGCSYAGVGARCGSRGGGGLLTAWRKTRAARGASRRREPSERRSHRRAATGSRTPNPADHQADRAARPTAYFVRRKSQTTCSEDVGHVDFQLQSAACSRCSTPGSVRWGSMLSMVPAKPMVSKKPTPPVQNIETWATFESREPLKGRPELFASGQNYRCSEVGR